MKNHSSIRKFFRDSAAQLLRREPVWDRFLE